MSWLEAFVLTLAVEVPLALVCLRGRPRGRVVAAVVLANGASHPLLWFVLGALPGPFLANVLVGECGVVALEAIVYLAVLRPLRPGHALAVSATLNAASYLVGIALFNAPA
jgi:hypothetical protein